MSLGRAIYPSAFLVSTPSAHFITVSTTSHHPPDEPSSDLVSQLGIRAVPRRCAFATHLTAVLAQDTLLFRSGFRIALWYPRLLRRSPGALSAHVDPQYLQEGQQTMPP